MFFMHFTLCDKCTSNSTNAGQTSKPRNQPNLLLLLPTIFQQLIHFPSKPQQRRVPNPLNTHKPRIPKKSNRLILVGSSRHLKISLQQLPLLVDAHNPHKTQHLKTPLPSRSDVSGFTQHKRKSSKISERKYTAKIACISNEEATGCMQPQRGQLEQVGVVGKQATRTLSAFTMEYGLS